MTFDWSHGTYEVTAPALAPAAGAAVDAVGLRRGDRVVDLGCGTGSAALLAAARGAVVTGVDPAPRLLQLAREAAAQQGLDVRFTAGEAAAIPVPNGRTDAIVSNFGVIFAADPAAVATELARVAAPACRVAFTAWPPGGPLDSIVAVPVTAARAAGVPIAAGPGFAWHDRSAVASLLEPFGFAVAVTQRQLIFRAGSAEEFADMHVFSHPLAHPVLDRLGEAVRHDVLAAVRRVGGDGAGVCFTAPYALVTASR